MNILQLIENKSVIYLCLLFYFIFLYVLLLTQKNSSFVGFGFVFIWIISMFTKNIVVCVTGSFLLSCLMIVVCRNTKEGFFLDDYECNATCFARNEELARKKIELEGNIKSLNSTIGDRDGEIISLNKNIGDLDSKINKFSQLTKTVFEISSS